MKTNTIQQTPECALAQAPINCRIIKIAFDVHAANVVAALQYDDSNPRPPQTFTYAKLEVWLLKLKATGAQLYTCYEAGPTGFHLHRRLEALGIKNIIVCPSCLDSRRRGVNNDKTDALELLNRLGRYAAGNLRSFSVVRVPTLEEELRRFKTRQRNQFARQRLAISAMGRTFLLLHGIQVTNSWWHPVAWQSLQKQLPPHLLKVLEGYYPVIQALQTQIQALLVEIRARSRAASKPIGLGNQTVEEIEAEVMDWNRLTSWRKAGSFVGLTGGVSSSGTKHADLSITKRGNPRLRVLLVELAWRMLRYQPDYWLVKKWSGVLCSKSHVRRRKQAIVAFARQLFVDIWKWKTGRAKPEDFGWAMTA